MSSPPSLTIYTHLLTQRENIHTVQDALHGLALPQPVTVSPRGPGAVPIEASQQVLIDGLPPVLVLHMKRFLYDANGGGVMKLGKKVTFGEELEVGGG